MEDTDQHDRLAMATNTQRFYHDYGSQFADSSRTLRPRQAQFWNERSQRPTPVRRVSDPALWSAPAKHDTRAAWYRQLGHARLRNSYTTLKAPVRHVTDMFRNILHRAHDPLQMDIIHYLEQIKVFLQQVFQQEIRWQFTVGITLLILFLVSNSLAAQSATDFHRKVVLSQYGGNVPPYMFPDIVQGLGYPATVQPGITLTKSQIKKGYQHMQKNWHPDKLTKTGIPSEEASKLWLRTQVNKDLAELVRLRPYCRSSIDKLLEREASNFSYNDGLPNFAAPCRCTMPKFCTGLLTSALTPFPYSLWKLTHLKDQNKTALTESFCPCSWAEASSSWNSFAHDKQPPKLRRISDVLSWRTMDYRVIIYKLRTMLRPLDLDQLFHEDPEAVKRCRNGSLDICAGTKGWLSGDDFLPSTTRCLHGMSDFMQAKEEYLSLKKELELREEYPDEDAHDYGLDDDDENGYRLRWKLNALEELHGPDIFWDEGDE